MLQRLGQLIQSPHCIMACWQTFRRDCKQQHSTHGTWFTDTKGYCPWTGFWVGLGHHFSTDTVAAPCSGAPGLPPLHQAGSMQAPEPDAAAVSHRQGNKRGGRRQAHKVRHCHACMIRSNCETATESAVPHALLCAVVLSMPCHLPPAH